MKLTICEICNSASESETFVEGNVFYDHVICSRCGKYFITDVAKDAIQAALQMDSASIKHYLQMPSDDSRIGVFIEVARKADQGKGTDDARSIISHVLRKRTDKGAALTCSILISVLKNNSPPTPAQQANNFITFLGGRLASPGDSFDIHAQIPSNKSRESIYALLGLRTGTTESRDFIFLISSLGEQKILDFDEQGAILSGGKKIPSRVSLTMAGWQKYEELQRSVTDSRRAFVAMEFPSTDNPERNYFFQNTLLDNYLIPAVRSTGFDLANALRSEPKAGNIHARLEVEIRGARFVVAELSNHNNGPIGKLVLQEVSENT
ncbi:MAG: hypothetical protein WB715_22125 [Roseiarcus sp.]|uniref:hypothetical protein n=1 Tax=Roseiarcus sp. TaxID=1969460 RepID=UPI003C3741B3